MSETWIEYKSIDDIKPAKRNPRQHDAASVAMWVLERLE